MYELATEKTLHQLFRAKHKDWKTNPEHKNWIEGLYVQLPKSDLGSGLVAIVEGARGNSIGHYLVQNQIIKHPLYSNGFPYNIFECEIHEIDPFTLCEYTRAEDDNGVKIYENDIIQCFRESYGVDTKNKIIVFDDYEFDFRASNGVKDPSTTSSEKIEYLSCIEEIKVIGNKFDNPDLMNTLS